MGVFESSYPAMRAWVIVSSMPSNIPFSHAACNRCWFGAFIVRRRHGLLERHSLTKLWRLSGVWRQAYHSGKSQLCCKNASFTGIVDDDASSQISVHQWVDFTEHFAYLVSCHDEALIVSGNSQKCINAFAILVV